MLVVREFERAAMMKFGGYFWDAVPPHSRPTDVEKTNSGFVSIRQHGMTERDKKTVWRFSG